jgi:hypothetical protein
LSLLGGYAPLRYYESLLVLADVGAGLGPSRWKEGTQALRRQSVAFRIVAFSYAVGPAVLTALETDICERLRFVAAVGGYHDLYRAVRFFTTGYFEKDGKGRQI